MPPDAMEVPFRELYAEILTAYGRGVWPAQALLGLLALAAVAAVVVRPGRFADATAKVTLDFLWTWCGAVFFIMNVGAIYKEGYAAGAAFILFGTFLLLDVIYGHLEFRPFASRVNLALGGSIVVAAAVIYPAAAYALGRPAAALQLVGSAPGPTAAFTLGMLVWSLHKPVPLYVAFPALWVVGAGVAATALGFYEDGILVGAAGAAVFAMLAATRAPSRPSPTPPPRTS